MFPEDQYSDIVKATFLLFLQSVIVLRVLSFFDFMFLNLLTLRSTFFLHVNHPPGVFSYFFPLFDFYFLRLGFLGDDRYLFMRPSSEMVLVWLMIWLLGQHMQLICIWVKVCAAFNSQSTWIPTRNLREEVLSKTSFSHSDRFLFHLVGNTSEM